MKIIAVDPRPTQFESMATLLQNAAPVVGVEFTLPTLAHLLVANIDGQHNPQGGQAAIELALQVALPPVDATYAVVRPDPDALGAIAVLEIRRKQELAASVLDRVRYIAREDSFDRGTWPGPRTPEVIQNPDRVLFGALTALCMNFKSPIERRVALMQEWLLTGSCEGLDEAIAQVEKNNASAIIDAEVVSLEGDLVVLKAHTMGATSVGYCYAPIVVIANDRFTFPGVEAKHLKYTICQYQPGYVDLGAVVEDLNKIDSQKYTLIRNGIPVVVETTWGGSPTIVGSPQGVSSSVALDKVATIVKQHLL